MSLALTSDIYRGDLGFINNYKEFIVTKSVLFRYNVNMINVFYFLFFYFSL